MRLVVAGRVIAQRPLSEQWIPVFQARASTRSALFQRLSATVAGAPIVRAFPDAKSAGLAETDFAAGDFNPPRFSTVQGCRSLSTGTSFIGHYCFANGLAAGSGNATAVASGHGR